MKGSYRPDIGKGGLGELLDRYPVTFGVLGAILVVFLFELLKNTDLAPYGACHHSVVARQPWRLVTCMFLHAGFLHLALNALALFFVGRILEIHYGWARMWVLYVLFGLAGSLGSAGWDIIVVKSRLPYFSADNASVGASGAICGLILLGFVYGRAESHRLGTLARSLQTWILYGAVFTFLFPGVDVAGHVCGAAAGAIAGHWIQPRPGEEPHPAWKPLAIVLAFLCLACFGGMVWAMRHTQGLPM